MRKIAVGGLIAVMLGSGIRVADSAYVIKLRNGNGYITDRYWYDGAQVLFDTYGGVFGVDKAFVAKIEKSDQVARLAATAPAPDAVKDPRANSDPRIKDPAEAKPGLESQPEKKRGDDDSVVSEYNRLKEKSKEVGGMLTSEIRDLLNQITSFKNNLARDSKLFIEYGREFNAVHELATAVETALESRTQ